MPSKSKAQQRFMGMVHALNKGEMDPSDASPEVKKVAKSMTEERCRRFCINQTQRETKQSDTRMVKENN